MQPQSAVPIDNRQSAIDDPAESIVFESPNVQANFNDQRKLYLWNKCLTRGMVLSEIDNKCHHLATRYWDGQLKSVKGCWSNIGLLLRML